MYIVVIVQKSVLKPIELIFLHFSFLFMGM